MKAVLAVEKGIIPPTYGFTNPNPRSEFLKPHTICSPINTLIHIVVKWDEWKVKVNTEAIPWPKHLPVRRASVNSFGYGGTNAHIIIEAIDSIVPSYVRGRLMHHSIPAAITSGKEDLCSSCINDLDEGYRSGRDVAGKEVSSLMTRTSHTPNGNTPMAAPADDRTQPSSKRQHFLLPFSAHDPDVLKANIKKLAEVCNNHDLLDLAFTLSGRRSVLAKRAFSITRQSTLSSDLEEESLVFGDVKEAKQPRLAFVFTGM